MRSCGRKIVVHRKTAPRVVGGRTLRKNRHEQSRGLIDETRPYPEIARERAGRGYRHIVGQRDIAKFIDLVPDWASLSHGLHAIVLAAGRDDADGYCKNGVVHLCAWDLDLYREVTAAHYREHKDVLERIGVPCEFVDDEDWVLCRFTENTVRAYQLLHILMHELGHHHDRMTTRSKIEAARGEDFAESFAIERERQLWDRYVRVFPV